MNRILTVDVLTKAIRNGIDKKGLESKEAKKMAEHIMNFFGYSDRIIDNMLEPEDRDMFYQLEDWELLLTEREEITLYDGREWRIHYWLLKKDKIFELANSSKYENDGRKKPEEASIYEKLSDEVWERKENTNEKNKN